MEKIESLRELEKLILKLDNQKGKEQLFVATRKFYQDIGKNNQPSKVEIDNKKETEFLNKCSGIYVYHYHTHNVRSVDYKTKKPLILMPPSLADFYYERESRKRINTLGKKLISRAVEYYGVWQYRFSSERELPKNMDILIWDAITVRPRLEDTQMQLKDVLELYGRFNLDVKFRKFDQT